jgi:hypothetical protein
MSDRHYGLDVKVMMIGTSDVKAVFENCDFSDDSIVKESQAAQDTGPNRRVLGNDFTLTLNKFVEGSADWLMTYCKTHRNNINLQFVMTAAGSGSEGANFKTITINGAIVNKMGLTLGGDPTKESLEFKRGAGGDYTIT